VTTNRPVRDIVPGMDRALRILVQHHRVRLPAPAAVEDRPVGRDVLATLANMSEAEYWLRQILMYWGLLNEWFTEEPVERPLLDERLRLKVNRSAPRRARAQARPGRNGSSGSPP